MAACLRPKFGHPRGYRLEWYTVGTVVYYWIFDSEIEYTYLKLFLSYKRLFRSTASKKRQNRQDSGLL